MVSPVRIGLRGVLAASLAATGCAQLAGIEETTELIPPERVSLSFDRLSIGATLVRSPMDLTDQRATYLVPDDSAADGLSRITAEVGPTSNTWSAVVEGDSPPILFELPNAPTTTPRLWALPNRDLWGVFGVLEHPSPALAPAGATLTVQATLPTPYAAGQAFMLYTVGTWISRAFSATEIPAVGANTLGPVTFAYDSTTRITGRPHERIMPSDVVLLLRYVGNQLTGVMEAPPFEQTGTDMVMGAMTAVATAEMLDVTLLPGAVAARFVPARPAMGNIAMQWNLTAAPGFAMANVTGPRLHAGAVLPTDSGAIRVAYGNPFAAKGWRTVLTWSTIATRSFTPAGQTLPATLFAALHQVVEPTAAMTLDLPAGLPEVITLDARALSSDGLMIPKPTRPVVASFVAGPATTTLYQLTLFELVPNMANTALEYKVVVEATGARPEFSLPPELFAPGKHYTLRAITIAGGYPNVGAGDLSERALPIALGLHDSGVFTIKP